MRCLALPIDPSLFPVFRVSHFIHSSFPFIANTVVSMKSTFCFYVAEICLLKAFSRAADILTAVIVEEP